VAGGERAVLGGERQTSSETGNRGCAVRQWRKQHNEDCWKERSGRRASREGNERSEGRERAPRGREMGRLQRTKNRKGTTWRQVEVVDLRVLVELPVPLADARL